MSSPEHLFDPTGVSVGRGRVEVKEVAARSILTKATGFMSAYDYTLNPYGGCAFGCTYCYAAFFARDRDLQDRWGYWVQVKANAVALIRRTRRPLEGRSIYMSSVTDPYQPVERRLGLTRAILEELVPRRPQLVVQTRSPVVIRDADLFMELPSARVNVTVTTDSDRVRRAFEPSCPSNDRRLEAAAALVRAGVDTRITLTPLLPVEDPHGFARRLAETGVTRFVVQPFHGSGGRFVAGTRERAVAEIERTGWTEAGYRETVRALRAALPSVIEGREGFAP